jgi:hypothetical protein
MNTSLDLGEIHKRPTKYWNADGLPELMMGLLWIVWAGAWLVGESLPHGKAWNIYWMFTPALLAVSGVASIWATKKLKARITFPRAGYVEWKEPSRAQRVAAGATAMVTAAVLAALTIRARTHGAERVAPMVMGVILSLAFLVASLTQRAPHMLAFAGVALMLGLAFAAINLGWQSLNWMLLALGTTVLIGGAVRLSLFLRRNPPEHHR